MRIIKCDVCGTDYGPADDMIEMVIPASFLDEEGEGIAIDVCGWPCVNQVVDSALNTPQAEEEPASQPEEPVKPFVMVPKTPTIDTDMDPAEMARYTEAVTGVKRRT
jgi:hypothetical protein